MDKTKLIAGILAISAILTGCTDKKEPDNVSTSGSSSTSSSSSSSIVFICNIDISLSPFASHRKLCKQAGIFISILDTNPPYSAENGGFVI